MTLCAFASSSKEEWVCLITTNVIERLNKELSLFHLVWLKALSQLKKRDKTLIDFLVERNRLEG